MSQFKVKPFGKYPGNKYAAAKTIRSYIPNDVWDNKRYLRILFGGVCGFATAMEAERVVVSEINTQLVRVYSAIKEEYLALYDMLMQYHSMFESCRDMQEMSDLYYTIRRSYNASNGLYPAQWIVLNKTGFNGLMRYNKSGGFNTPFGKRTLPEPNMLNLHRLHVLFKNWRFYNNSYEAHTGYVSSSDLVYADPPYVDQFSAYDKSPIGRVFHEQLADKLYYLSNVGVYVVLSTANNEESLRIYKRSNLVPHEIMVSKSISANGDGRGKKSELLWLPERRIPYELDA